MCVSQNFHTKKSSEISLFCAVSVLIMVENFGIILQKFVFKKNQYFLALKWTHSFAFQEIKNVIFTTDLFIFTKAKFFKMVWKFWTIVADALI